MTEPRYQVFKVDPLELDEWGVLDNVEHYGICSEMTKDNAELVATVLNERPQIVTLITRLQNYGDHQRWCHYHNTGNDFDCNCGWITVLAEGVEWRQAINRSQAEIVQPAPTKGK